MRFISDVTQQNTGIVHFLSGDGGEQRGEEMTFYCFFFYLLCVFGCVCVCFKC